MVGFNRGNIFYFLLTKSNLHVELGRNMAEALANIRRLVKNDLGFLLALLLCVFIAVGLVIGFKSPFKAVRFFCRSYTEIVRGSPLLVILIVGYYVIAEAFSVGDRLLVGVVLLAVFSGAYLGEILRGGIDSVGKTQFEAARAVGFSTYQTYRYVIIPQAVRRVLPAVAGLFIMLVKDSSLLSVIGAEEFTKRTEIARAATLQDLRHSFLWP